MQYWFIQDLTEAHKFHILHHAIDKLTTDFMSTALDLLAVEGTLEHSPLALSLTEIHRVQRSFYLLEILCCIWREGPLITSWGYTWSMPLYIEFPPWVNDNFLRNKNV